MPRVDRGLIKWYKPHTDDPAGFVACEACFEDCVLTNQLSNMFVPVPEGLHSEEDTWACDMSL